MPLLTSVPYLSIFHFESTTSHYSENKDPNLVSAYLLVTSPSSLLCFCVVAILLFFLFPD